MLFLKKINNSNLSTMGINRCLVNSAQNMPFKKLVKAMLYAIEDVIGGDSKNNAKLKNKFYDKRCFLLGTGVSLDEIDPLFLNKEYVFACNLMFMHKDFSIFNANFYAIIQSFFGFIYAKPHDIYLGIDESSLSEETLIFLRAFNKLYIEKSNFFKDKQKIYVKPGGSFKDADKKSFDLTERIDYFDGAFAFMVAAATYMGFKELYLCGFGYTYSPILEFHFYDEMDDLGVFQFPWEKPMFPLSLSKNERRRLSEEFAIKRGLEIYKNYYTDSFEVVRYTKKGDLSLKYQPLNDFAIENGVKIINIVPEGFDSHIFEKTNFSSIFSNS
jgi:hypothetical protein